MCDTKKAAKTTAKSKDLTTKKGGGNGSNKGTQNCCPDVAEFKKRSTRADYFGFDDKTNLPAKAADSYAQPPTKKKTAPSKRDTRDGAVWLSVAVGETTKCTINFTNHLTCISNCTYEVKPAKIASVLTMNIAADRALFEIRGNAKGDCTIIVKCGGKDIGWVHVACYPLKTYNIAICEVNQKKDPKSTDTSAASLTLPRSTIPTERFQTFFDDAFRDAAVKVNVTGLPVHYVGKTVDFGPKGGFFDANGEMEYPAVLKRKSSKIDPKVHKIHKAVKKAHPSYDKYLYIIVAPGTRDPAKSYLNGFARKLKGAFAVFFNMDNGAESTACHEFGHLIGLRHPNDPSGTSQFPKHLRAKKDNVAANDTLNLMGYGHPRSDRKRLRYKQWKAIPRK